MHRVLNDPTRAATLCFYQQFGPVRRRCQTIASPSAGERPPWHGRTLDNAIDRLLDVLVAGTRRPVYVISIAASLAGCHPRTLRIYEEEGLLDPVRTDTNIRLYSDDDLERVRAIRYLTQTRGVNLAGVKLLLQLRDAADFLDEIAEHLARDDAQLETPQPLPVTNEASSRKPRTRQRQKGVEL